MEYQDINAATIDRWIDEGWEWGRPIDHETYVRATQGDWAVKLTPTKAVPRAWFGDLKGAKSFARQACRRRAFRGQGGRENHRA